MKFREATEEDFKFMANHSVSRGIQKHCPEQTDYVFALEHEGDLLGIGGFRLINTTTAWAWVDMSHIAGKYITTSYRTIKEWIDIFVKEHNLKRLQAYVECDFPEAIRMVKHLGFHEESRMKNFMGDKAAFMFVRIL